jgi:hypothetical protein
MVIKVKTRTSERRFSLWIKLLLRHKAKFIHPTVEETPLTELKFKLACKGVLMKLHTFSIDGLTKTVLTVYQNSMLVWNTIHQLIEFKEIIKKG